MNTELKATISDLKEWADSSGPITAAGYSLAVRTIEDLHKTLKRCEVVLISRNEPHNNYVVDLDITLDVLIREVEEAIRESS